ncbi:hypothetical protein [Knoellia koreensis]|uniref:Methylase-associated X1 domain-containing protein n=1 Tax=Knoellia koreensis TaxID=2730921 RepID=A0A849HNQ9_9MICO|nr:hypothetical protein [Knoellia sp. DB2414S]NNM48174.1 hypothetical protein [Knoellia sp. DB2414S]
MGTVNVDQLSHDGTVVQDVDTKLSNAKKHELLIEALPDATLETHSGMKVVRFGNQIILAAQVTHLGYPWAEFKKRIQIPKRWLEVHQGAVREGLTPRFVGVYHYRDVTVFVDFDPTTYVRRAVNNSAAHVATNDLYQAQTAGQFSREDKNGNRLTSIRGDQLATYLLTGYSEKNAHIDVFDGFSTKFMDGMRIEGLTAVQEMHAARWPDTFQNEWAGFYVEYRLHQYLAAHGLTQHVQVQKEKRRGAFDYDLRFLRDGSLEYYGDLKASSIAVSDSPGNDKDDFLRALDTFGRFWYVIFEHETWHSRDNSNLATIAWNEWRRSVGHVGRKGTYDPLSYQGRFKEAVRFMRVNILEVNPANVGIVLKDFQKDFRQPDGKPRKAKVSIRKKDIDNFLIYTRSIVPASD